MEDMAASSGGVAAGEVMSPMGEVMAAKPR
jgi:hypothetical protein